MYAAIDVAAAKVLRQLRKYKTRVIDRKLRAEGETIRAPETAASGELDVDGLMDELAGEEIVREKVDGVRAADPRRGAHQDRLARP